MQIKLSEIKKINEILISGQYDINNDVDKIVEITGIPAETIKVMLDNWELCKSKLSELEKTSAKQNTNNTIAQESLDKIYNIGKNAINNIEDINQDLYKRSIEVLNGLSTSAGETSEDKLAEYGDKIQSIKNEIIENQDNVKGNDNFANRYQEAFNGMDVVKDKLMGLLSEYSTQEAKTNSSTRNVRQNALVTLEGFNSDRDDKKYEEKDRLVDELYSKTNKAWDNFVVKNKYLKSPDIETALMPYFLNYEGKHVKDLLSVLGDALKNNQNVVNGAQNNIKVLEEALAKLKKYL